MATLADFYKSQGQSLPSLQQRQPLAQQAGIQNYTGTAQQNTQLLNFLRNRPQTSTQATTPVASVNQNAPTIAQRPTTPSNVPLATLNTPPVQIPTLGQPQPPVPQINESDRILQEMQVEDTQAQKTAQQLSSSIFDVLPQLMGEKQALAEEQTRAGLPQLRQTLQDINNQIIKKQAEIAQDDVTLVAQMRAEERRDTLLPFARSGQAKLQGDAQIARALKKSEIGVLNAQALAAQGNIALAQETAQQAVDLKFAPYREFISIAQAQLQALDPILSRDEKKQTTAQELKMNLALKRIDREAEKEKTIQSFTIEAAKNGAPQSVINMISRAKSFEEAIRIGGQYMADPLDRSIKAAQLRKLNADITKLNNEQKDAVVNSVVNEKDPTKLISTFFRSNPKLKTNQDINNAAAVVSSINEFAGTVGGGKITGYGFLGGGFKPEAFSSQSAIRNRAKIAAVEGKLQQWLSGAALSKAQEKLVRKMVPERNDTDATIRTKLNQLTNYMLGDIKGRASAQGGQFEYIPVDLFSPDSVEPSLSSSVTQAVASGYQPQEVIDFVSQNYPDQAVKIRQAQDAGYSPEEIIEYLSLQ